MQGHTKTRALTPFGLAILVGLAAGCADSPTGPRGSTISGTVHETYTSSFVVEVAEGHADSLVNLYLGENAVALFESGGPARFNDIRVGMDVVADTYGTELREDPVRIRVWRVVLYGD